MQKEGQGNVRVLLIPPLLERNLESFVKLFEEDHLLEWFTFYTFPPVCHKSDDIVDYLEVLNKCREIIKSENISVLFANQEVTCMISSILCEEIPRITGPSLESMFLCSHRYYTVQHVDSRKEKLPYLALSLNQDPYDLSHQILSKLKLPCTLQSCIGKFVAFARNRDELIKAIVESQKGVMYELDLHKDLTDKFIDQSKYPAASKPVILVRSFLDRSIVPDDSTSSWVNVFIEACLYQRKIIPWAIASSVVPKESRSSQIFSGFEMPSSLSSSIQSQVWKVFKGDITALVKRGFNNSFVHAEYKVFADGYIHLERIAGSVRSDLTPMYLQALSQGNNVHASLQVALQVKPDAPKPNGSYVLCHLMIVLESGKASNLIRFDKADNNDSVFIRYLPGQDIVIPRTRKHAVIGSITIKGANYKDCLAKIKEIRKEVLRLPELVPLSISC